MKRFTSTDKWRDPWFRRLSHAAKLLWVYLCDNCNDIGLIEIDFTLVSQDCGITVSESHMGELGDRAVCIKTGVYFLPKFIPFQYKNLSDSCPPHRAILRLIDKHRLTKTDQGYSYPNATLGLGYHENHETHKDKDKDKDKDKVLEKGTDREKEKEKAPDIECASLVERPTQSPMMQFDFNKAKTRIGALFSRRAEARWSYEEEHALGELSRREEFWSELKEIEASKRFDEYFPRSVGTLLTKWTATLDKARFVPPKKPGEMTLLEKEVEQILRS